MAEKTNYKVLLKDANGGVIWPQTTITNLVDLTTGASITVATETQLTSATDRIIALLLQLGTGGEGSSVITRIEALLLATDVAITGTETTSIITDYGTTENPDNQIRSDYMPDLSFQGKSVGKLAKSVNIIGVGNVAVDENGNITLRLGLNLNSSLFHTTDGTTNGTVSATTGTITGSRTLADGTSKAIWLKGTNTVTVQTAGLIHFDDNTTGAFQLKVNDKVFAFGPITGNGTYGADTAVAKLVVSGFGEEANAATGATGYSGKIAVTFNAGAMEFADGYVSVLLSQTAGTAGATKVFTSNNLFYLVNDTATKANATEATVTLSGVSSKVLSGVRYLTGATVTYNAVVLNVGNPATYAAATSPVVFNNNGWATDKTANVAYNATTASATAALIDGQFDALDTTVEVSVKNVNGEGGTTATASLNKALLIDSTATTGALDAYEPFNDLSRRLTNAAAEWQEEYSLADGAAGAEGLMVTRGTLIYPAGTFTGTNDGLAGITGSAQPTYTGNVTGTRTYIRKFFKDASMPGGTIQINSEASLEDAINAGTLKILIAKVAPTGAATDVWYDIGFRTVGDQTANCIGKSNSSYGTVNKLVYAFSDGNADQNLWIRISMSSAVAVLEDITLL